MAASFGFINGTSIRQNPIIAPSDSISNSLSINFSEERLDDKNRSCTKVSILRYLFVLSLSIAEICFIQFALKTEHQHPHVPSEKDLQSLNIYFNIIVIYLSLNTLWYPLTHVSQRLQKYQANIHFVYCILWGAAAGMLLPIEFSPIETSRLHLTHLYISLIILLLFGLYE
jgi:hypothetical protein